VELRKLVPFLTLVIIILLALAIWFYPSSEDFRTDNPSWNGLKRFAAEFDASRIESLQGSSLTPGGSVLLVIPYEEFVEPELQELKEYVSSGGTLMIFDDYGYGNHILDYFGLEASFSGKRLLDPLLNYENKWFPKIVDFSETRVTKGVESIVLNHASSLSGVSDDQVLARSSAFSFLDVDGDAAWDEDEPTGPLPVAAHIRLDKGSIVLVADPSILINSMIDMENNLTFIRNIVGIQGPNPKVVVDQSHLPKAAADDAKEVLAVTRKGLSSPVGMVGLVVAILTFTLGPVWRRKGGSNG
jgi:hypothetical protein